MLGSLFQFVPSSIRTQFHRKAKRSVCTSNVLYQPDWRNFNCAILSGTVRIAYRPDRQNAIAILTVTQPAK
jgi:hypothetical protein